MALLRSSSVVLAFLVALWGCGSGGGANGGGGSSGGGSSGSAPTSIALAEFPSEYMDAYCDTMARCGFMPDKATCEAVIVLDLPQLVAGVKAEKIKYDANAAAACTANIRSLPCTDDRQAFRCMNAFKPLVVNGGACFLDEECTSRNCDTGSCYSTTKCCPGTCRPAEDCIDTGCPDGQFCRRGDGSHSCQPKAKLGQPCTWSESDESSCVSGAICVGELDSSTCIKIPSEGQACEPKSDYVDCDEGLYCNVDTLKCARWVPVGGACSTYACVKNAHCDSTGRCVAALGLGERCDRELDRCLGDLECLSGFCTFPPASPVCE